MEALSDCERGSIFRQFALHDPGFCESELFGQHEPEWVSTVTAFCIIFYGISGLYQIPYPQSIWQIIFSFLAFNGIGSVGFHFTKWHGFGLTDGYTMIIPFHLVSYHCCNVLCYQYFILNKGELVAKVPSVAAGKENAKAIELKPGKKKYVYNPKRFHFITSSLCLVHVFSCTLFIALNAYESMTAYASLLMGASLAIQLWLALNFMYDDEIRSKQEFIMMRNMLIQGIVVAVASAVLWISTETLCEGPRAHYMKFIPAHALWHVAMSWALYRIGMALLFMDTHNVGLNPYFKYKKAVHRYFLPVLRLRTRRASAHVPKLSTLDTISVNMVQMHMNDFSDDLYGPQNPVEQIVEDIKPKHDTMTSNELNDKIEQEMYKIKPRITFGSMQVRGLPLFKSRDPSLVMTTNDELPMDRVYSAND